MTSCFAPQTPGEVVTVPLHRVGTIAYDKFLQAYIYAKCGDVYMWLKVASDTTSNPTDCPR